MVTILEDICRKRSETILQKGIEFGCAVPEKRTVPLIRPDLTTGALICEIKRGSPSEGRMREIEDAAQTAGEYIQAGANVISVLTEENFFFGSLNDLIRVKSQYPDVAVLRKDFLQSAEEIDVAYRAGADWVLLIAAMFDDSPNGFETMLEMKQRAESFGMQTLIEVHNQDELNFILPMNPRLIGINSRDLKSFRIDRNYPVALKSLLPDCDVIFESGIRNRTDAFFIGTNGFAGMLIGTSIVKSSDINSQIRQLQAGFRAGTKVRSEFFRRIFHKIYIENKLAVKICGITNIEDAELAVELGADAIGFVFADSPRQVSVEMAREISQKIGNRALKVGVVTKTDSPEIVQAICDGWLDAVQLHGSFPVPELEAMECCWYQALPVKDSADLERPPVSPFTLFDAFSKSQVGGTGKTIQDEIIQIAVKKRISLYLAGGINPGNVVQILEKYRPKLIDLSSGLESAPGKKDATKMKDFFDKIRDFR